jgi:hypothetical protein
VFRSYLRMGVYQAAGMFGIQSWIAVRRVEKLSGSELHRAQAVVDQIATNLAEREDAACAVR